MGKVSTSFIRTSGASTDLRVRDQLSRTFNARPQPATIYIRFRAQHIDFTTPMAYLQLGQGNSVPRLQVDHFTSFRATFLTQGGNRESTVNTTGINIGDTVELRVTLASTGVVQISRAVNGGSETTGSTTGSGVIDPEWSEAVVWLNSRTTSNVNFCAYRNLRIVRGVRTLQYMRRLAGV